MAKTKLAILPFLCCGEIVKNSNGRVVDKYFEWFKTIAQSQFETWIIQPLLYFCDVATNQSSLSLRTFKIHSHREKVNAEVTSLQKDINIFDKPSAFELTVQTWWKRCGFLRSLAPSSPPEIWCRYSPPNGLWRSELCFSDFRLKQNLERTFRNVDI